MKFKWKHLVFLSIFLFQACSPECPNSKQYIRFEAQRLSEIRSKLQNMSVASLMSLSQKYGFRVEFTSQGTFKINARPQSLIIKFFSGTSSSSQQEVLTAISGTTQHVFSSSGALVVRVPQASTDLELVAYVQALNELKSVEYASLDKIIKLNVAPNDPQFEELDSLNPASPLAPVVNVRALEAWQKTRGSRNVVVGVVDTGIDYNHPDLVDNIWTNPGESGLDSAGRDKRSNGIDDDGNGFIDDFRGWDFVSNDNDPMDDHFHGTHVAGTIGAVGNNRQGIAGVNWEVSLVGLKFLDQDGSGSLSNAVRAIEYATRLNIPITNNSWGFFGEDRAIEEAIAAAGRNGMLFVAAAGNESLDNDGPFRAYPASYDLDNIISVAAVDQSNGNMAPFSNYGLNKVHVGAPGVNILSTINSSCRFPQICGSIPDGYGRASGTSMAAPHVAGAAALIKAQFPSSSVLELKSRIIFSGTKLQSLNGRVKSGAVLNLNDSLEEDSNPPSAVESVQVSNVGITTLSLSWPQSGDDNSSGLASFYEARFSSSIMQSENDWDKGERVNMNLLWPVNSSFQSSSDMGSMRAVIRSLPLDKRGYVTLRAIDNAGNLSPIRMSIPYALSPADTLFEKLNATNTSEMTFSPAFGSPKAWNRESVRMANGRQEVIFSDSPPTRGNSAGLYENQVDASMYLKPVQIAFPDALIQFETKLSCEPNADWAYVEYNRNNEIDPQTNTTRWNRLAEWSQMYCDWTRVSLQFGYLVAPGDIVTLRLRFTTDGAGREEGWLIKNIKMLGVAPPLPPSNLQLSIMNSQSDNRLSWFDNSAQETHFEIGYQANERLGDASFVRLHVAAANNTYFNYPSSPSEPLTSRLRVRACNGVLCSPSSSKVTYAHFTSRIVYRRVRPAKGDFMFSLSDQRTSIPGFNFEGEAFRVFSANALGRIPIYSCVDNRTKIYSLSNRLCRDTRLTAYGPNGGLLGFLLVDPAAFPGLPIPVNRIHICSRAGKVLYARDASVCSQNLLPITGTLGFAP